MPTGTVAAANSAGSGLQKRYPSNVTLYIQLIIYGPCRNIIGPELKCLAPSRVEPRHSKSLHIWLTYCSSRLPIREGWSEGNTVPPCAPVETRSAPRKIWRCVPRSSGQMLSKENTFQREGAASSTPSRGRVQRNSHMRLGGNE